MTLATHSATADLTAELIACHSITPADGGCQEVIAARLEALGFEIETVISGPAQFSVTNLWAIKSCQRGH